MFVDYHNRMWDMIVNSFVDPKNKNTENNKKFTLKENHLFLQFQLSLMFHNRYSLLYNTVVHHC